MKWALLMSVLAIGGCVVGGGGAVGMYTGTRGDIGIALRGHTTVLGFRQADAPDDRPTGAPLLGIELGPAVSLVKPEWHLQMRVPIGAATWDDLEAEHGIRVSPTFVMDAKWKYDDSRTYEAYGGGLSTAYLRHLSYDGESYEGPDAHRIHRLGPVFSFSMMHDEEGWFGTFFMGLMYDYEAYVATGR